MQRSPAAQIQLASLILLLGCAVAAGCESPDDKSAATPSVSEQTSSRGDAASEPAKGSGYVEESTAEAEQFAEARDKMVREQLAGRDIEDPRVLEAMGEVRRHRYIPYHWREYAYTDRPLPIGFEQTISQPYIVATMTQALQVEPDHKVLEIGTGSGYQAAVLGELAGQVYSIEIVCELAERAREALDEAGYDNVHVRCGDGYKGWPKHAPFERIIVTAAPPQIPEKLVEQLARGGRMILPVGEDYQTLQLVTKDAEGEVHIEEKMAVQFVPMVPE